MQDISISANVGSNSPNKPADVVLIQTLFNHLIGIGRFKNNSILVIDGKCGSKTKSSIANFQFQHGLVTDQEHFENKITPHGPTMTFMKRNMGNIPKELLEKRTEEDISDILRSINVSNFARTRQGQEEFGIFIKLLLCELNGISVDCDYMVFTTKNVRGQEARDYDTINFISKEYDNNAVARLKRQYQMGRDIKQEAYNTYFYLTTSLGELMEWSQIGSSVGDAPISKFDGTKYLDDITRRICRLQPPSIYYAVGRRVQYETTRGIFSSETRASVYSSVTCCNIDERRSKRHLLKVKVKGSKVKGSSLDLAD